MTDTLISATPLTKEEADVLLTESVTLIDTRAGSGRADQSTGHPGPSRCAGHPGTGWSGKWYPLLQRFLMRSHEGKADQ